MKDLQGKVALITGGATGIGKALALELAKEPMKIVLASTSNERLEAAAEEIRKAGAIDVLTVICDVSSRDSVVNMHKEVTKIYGGVDLLVCNAGVTTGGPYLEHRPEDWDWVYDVVLQGTINCIQLFYPDLVKQESGHIVLVGSQAGIAPNWVSLHGPYTSAKNAVMTLGAALRPEAEEYGIGVSNIIVAGTLTEIMKAERSRPGRYGDALVLSKSVPKREARRIPASDVAEMIVDGVKKNKGWVATHPELKSVTKAYFDEILAAYDS
ncbi:NAD(P)-binding protein [Tothia fuscella]|uniref:NAD(P)-binding protein n=1 Tax=Tothia fuscella TaxID=1048955 RepID=A0A9P4NFU6_9PEZI|nr:NAD(P)-binding protein [Tothia fuscella]